MNYPQNDALEQFTASQAKPADHKTGESVAVDTRPIKIDPPKFFENDKQAAISALIIGGIFGILTIKACADAEWRPR